VDSLKVAANRLPIALQIGVEAAASWDAESCPQTFCALRPRPESPLAGLAKALSYPVKEDFSCEDLLRQVLLCSPEGFWVAAL
jgi:hypothetical protein